MRVVVSAAVLAVGLAGCGIVDSKLCTGEFRYGLHITVTDSATGSPPSEAMLLATSGEFYDSVGPMGPRQPVPSQPPELVLLTAGERPGLYSVVVLSPGYRNWTKNLIKVTSNECHVNTVELTAQLQP